MLLATLTVYGSSIVNTLVRIEGFVLLANEVSDTTIESPYNSGTVLFEETSSCGNVYESGVGRLKIQDTTSNTYSAKSILFYTLDNGTKKVVGFCSSSSPFVVKESGLLSLFISFDFSNFTSGVSFSSIQAGQRTATNNVDGQIHIEDSSTPLDDSYSVYSKQQVDSLISGSTSGFVTLTTTQTITGVKQFNNTVKLKDTVEIVNVDRNGGSLGYCSVWVKDSSNPYNSSNLDINKDTIYFFKNTGTSSSDATSSLVFELTTTGMFRLIGDGLYLSSAPSDTFPSSISQVIRNYTYNGTTHDTYDVIVNLSKQSSAVTDSYGKLIIKNYNVDSYVFSVDTLYFSQDQKLIWDTGHYIGLSSDGTNDFLKIYSEEGPVGLAGEGGGESLWAMDSSVIIQTLNVGDYYNDTAFYSLYRTIETQTLNLDTMSYRLNGRILNIYNDFTQYSCEVKYGVADWDDVDYLAYKESNITSVELSTNIGSVVITGDYTLPSSMNDNLGDDVLTVSATTLDPFLIRTTAIHLSYWNDIFTNKQSSPSSRIAICVDYSASDYLLKIVDALSNPAPIQCGEVVAPYISSAYNTQEISIGTGTVTILNDFVFNDYTNYKQLAISGTDSDGYRGVIEPYNNYGADLGSSSGRFNKVYAREFIGQLGDSNAQQDVYVNGLYFGSYTEGSITHDVKMNMYSHGIDVTGNITPYSGSTYDIGTSTYRWKNVYADTFTGALTGNASTASKLYNSRNINGMDFNGENDVIAYGTCGTSASQASKEVTISNFTLKTGIIFCVNFTYSNTASSPTLKVNSGTAYGLRTANGTLPGTTAATSWAAGTTLLLQFSGSYFFIICDTYAGMSKVRFLRTLNSSGTATSSVPSSPSSTNTPTMLGLTDAAGNVSYYIGLSALIANAIRGFSAIGYGTALSDVTQNTSNPIGCIRMLKITRTVASGGSSLSYIDVGNLISNGTLQKASGGTTSSSGSISFYSLSGTVSGTWATLSYIPACSAGTSMYSLIIAIRVY